MNFQGLIEQCDADIKAGLAAQAGKRLSSLNHVKVPREWRMPLAKICRRAGLFPLGLKILGPVMLAEKKLTEPATPAEQAEYAVLLQRSGALREALEILNGIDSNLVPEVLLYRAFVHFARWEFNEAIPKLQKYLEADLPPHAKMVAQNNLAFALVESQRNEEAMEALEELSSADNIQIRCNRHALLGQMFVQRGDYLLARKEFTTALGLVSGVHTNDQFFAYKWNLILDGLENQDLTKFEELGVLALKNRAWEARREADLYSLKVKFDHERLMRLYCGSPYPGFRDRLKSEMGVIPVEQSYVLGARNSPCMNLRSGLIDERQTLKSGHKCHQLLDLLLQDFYRPVRIGGIFSALFQDERFNPASSPHRIHQLLSRTRGWLLSEKIPVSINESDGFYSLEIEGSFSFDVPMQRDSVALPQLQMQNLKALFGELPFSARDATKGLNISQASAYRVITRGLEEGTLERYLAKNRATLFRIASLQKKTA